MMKSQSQFVEEVNVLVQALDISAQDAMEIINIYFECFADGWMYTEYLWDNIRIIKDTEENQHMIAELDTIDDACLFEGDGYYMLTNYHELIESGEIGDCLRNPF